METSSLPYPPYLLQQAIQSPSLIYEGQILKTKMTRNLKVIKCLSIHKSQHIELESLIFHSTVWIECLLWSREGAQTPHTHWLGFTQWWSTQCSRGAWSRLQYGNKKLNLGRDYGSWARVKQRLERWHLDPRMSCCWWEPRQHPSGIKPWAATKCENVYLVASRSPKSTVAAAAAAELQLEGVSAHLCAVFIGSCFSHCYTAG